MLRDHALYRTNHWRGLEPVNGWKADHSSNRTRTEHSRSIEGCLKRRNMLGNDEIANRIGEVASNVGEGTQRCNNDP